MSAETASGASADIHTGWTTRLRRVPVTLLFAWTLRLHRACLGRLAAALHGLQRHGGRAGEQLRAPSAEHVLGTDGLGRDVYARIVYGSRNRCPALSWPSRSACCSAPCSA